MRIAVVGVRGQLGSTLAAMLPGDVVPLSRDALDITDPAAVSQVIEGSGSDLVIHAAAYNFVDRAETEPQAAFAINALGTRHLALACVRLAVPLVYVSTDYVFGLDGPRHRPYRETDAAGPLGVYGTSKLAGEYFVRSLCPRHYVIRTCGLYGAASAGSKGNFVDKMLRLGAELGRVAVVDDQWCTPTSCADLAEAIVALIRTGEYGLYHATNAGGTTWCRFAAEIFRLAGMEVEVRPISTAEFNAPARRPAYSVFDTHKLAGAIGRELPEWSAALAAYLSRRM